MEYNKVTSCLTGYSPPHEHAVLSWRYYRECFLRSLCARVELGHAVLSTGCEKTACPHGVFIWGTPKSGGHFTCPPPLLQKVPPVKIVPPPDKNTMHVRCVCGGGPVVQKVTKNTYRLHQLWYPLELISDFSDRFSQFEFKWGCFIGGISNTTLRSVETQLTAPPLPAKIWQNKGTVSSTSIFPQKKTRSFMRKKSPKIRGGGT